MHNIIIDKLMQDSKVGFGTSGARGLVRDMSDEVCYLYTCAFLQHLQQSQQLSPGTPIALAGDLRPSTIRIMQAIHTAIRQMGYDCIYCGTVATPVMAAYAMAHGLAGIMVTGSHIPDDRNGIKFYKPAGEILKDDEAGMRQQTIEYDAELFDEHGMLLAPAVLPKADDGAHTLYVKRLVEFFPSQILQGLRVGVYEHSSVIRDTLTEVLHQLGAETISLGRSEVFIPVDTEAIREEDIALAKQWVQEHQLDAIASTDGDGDRPLLGDAQGNWLRGDVLGILCARYLHADIVVTPVSSNSAVELCGDFQQVIRTRIGSPFVIAAMESALLQRPDACVVGYEANGGFLQQSSISIDGRQLSPLPTRDSSLVIIAALALAQSQHLKLQQLVEQLPARYTYSDRIKDIPTQVSQAFLARFNSGNSRTDLELVNLLLGPVIGQIVSIDHTDGLRMKLTNGNIIHYRPSGNAPELRCYSEAATPDEAMNINQTALQGLRQILDT